MIFPLILLGCLYMKKQSNEGPVEVPGILYEIPETQDVLGLTETNDSYIITGWYSDDNVQHIALILKIDKNGNLMKYKIFSNLYEASRIYQDLQNPQEYFLLTQYGLAKIDKDFNLKWLVQKPKINSEWITDVLDTLNGNFILAGGTETKLLVWKITPNGQVIDSFVYNFSMPSIYRDEVLEVSNNSILVAISDYEKVDTNNYKYQILLVKLNENLDTLWTKRITLNNIFSGKGVSRPEGLMKTNDGGYILFAIYYYDNDDATGVAIKLDSNGNILRVRNFSEDDFKYRGQAFTTILQGGYTFTKLSDGSNMAILSPIAFYVPNIIWKFDDNLNTLCINYYPLAPGYGALYQLSDGNIGYATSTMIVDGWGDPIFTKIDKSCNILIWTDVYPHK